MHLIAALSRNVIQLNQPKWSIFQPLHLRSVSVEAEKSSSKSKPKQSYDVTIVGAGNQQPTAIRFSLCDS